MTLSTCGLRRLLTSPAAYTASCCLSEAGRRFGWVVIPAALTSAWRRDSRRSHARGWHQHYHEWRHQVSRQFLAGSFRHSRPGNRSDVGHRFAGVRCYHQAGLIFVAIEPHRTDCKGLGLRLGVGEAHRACGEVDVLGPDRSRLYRRGGIAPVLPMVV